MIKNSSYLEVEWVLNCIASLKEERRKRNSIFDSVCMVLYIDGFLEGAAICVLVIFP